MAGGKNAFALAAMPSSAMFGVSECLLYAPSHAASVWLSVTSS